jgi:hypothetical protein
VLVVVVVVVVSHTQEPQVPVIPDAVVLSQVPWRLILVAGSESKQSSSETQPSGHGSAVVSIEVVTGVVIS